MSSSAKKFNWKEFIINNNTFLILLLLIVISAMLSDTFLTPMNLRNILLQQAGPILVAIGLLYVILAGGIDLSVGSLMALGATVSALLITDIGLHFSVSIGIAVIVGLLFGVFSGFLVAYTGIQGFVATLATMTIARGIAFVITEGRPVRVEANTIDILVSKDLMYPIIFITILLIIIFTIIQRYTGFGRKIVAIGSNETAVKLAGVRTKLYVMSTYAISGSLAALAGVFIAARSSTGSATVGMGQELDAIAAVVIGGASLMGGRGFVLNTVAGALILGLIGNIMNLMAVPSYPQDIIKGAIIIAAVLLQIATSKKERTI
ncbi:ABC transporter permease [Psychrobacillus sp. INOP01]|uniref:ABC transporter permease n=1 Tax=Psychrobacillus sp. INOP01 TaxID=2829187 RepID=UPI001BA8F0CB|nr:ABC transporter permease [Psychrobacillus sp. INOP01]QUG40685.1 ABC transporter permease [Psychrobacillus sp. INOP01]